MSAADDRASAPAVRLSALDVASALGQPPPTGEQALVVEAPPEPLLVVAGAGSGKTETMAARVVWLVANGLVEPDRVLGLTFTRKAAGELADRVRVRLRALAAAGLLPPAAGDPGRRGGEGGACEAGEPTVSTYHSYAASVLGDHGMRLGVEPGARLLGEAAAWQLASDVVDGWDDLGDLDAAPATVTAAVLELAAACAEHLVAPDAVDRHLRDLLERASALPGRVPAPLRDLLARLRHRRLLLPLLDAYAERKRDLGVLDHGDQVALAARLAAGVPAVATTERARWGAVLLDEYQDTSFAQAELLRSLFGGGHPVTAVGDPHQSIYGWRGASAGGLEEFAARFPRADGAPAAVAALSTSWRNDAAVLEAAGAVAAPLRERSGLALPRLEPRPGAGPGRVRVEWRESAAEEAEAVAAALAEQWRADERGPDGQGDHEGQGVARHRTMAVLCRTRALFRPVEEALRARGLPVEVVGVGGLLSRPEVVDVVAALRLAHDPGRGDAALRLLTGPRWRLGARDLVVLAAWSRRHPAARPPAEGAAGGHGSGPAAGPGGPVDVADLASLADAVDDPPPPGWSPDGGRELSPAARERTRELAGVLRRVRAAIPLALPDLVDEAARALGLDVELAARPATTASDALADLDALAEAARDFADGGGGLAGLLAWLDAAADHERGLALGALGDVEAPADGPSRRAVQLLTVHAAKGLEWDVVAVPGLVDGVLPARRGRGTGWLSGLGALPYPLRGDAPSLPVLDVDDATDAPALERARTAFLAACADHDLAEERRLAYVALTRARTHLLLTGSWWGSTGSRPRRPSPFLRDVVAALGDRALPGGALPTEPVDTAGGRSREPARALWPVDPLGGARADVEAAARAVRDAVAALDAPAAPRGAGEPTGASAWDGEVDLLLAERDARASAVPTVVLPPHLSASRLVDLAADPGALALAVRRPVPVRPHEATRRGTAFHAWLEERFRTRSLFDPDDLGDLGVDAPGALDAGPGAAGVPGGPSGEDGGDGGDEPAVAALQAAFLASEWAQRTPIAVEVDLETPVGPLVVRCRVDAVFARPDGGVDVVDWKTGAPPTGARAAAAAVQLAVYRLAWSRLHGVPLADVHAAFFDAARGTTRRPVDLLDAAGLERLVTRLPAAPDPDHRRAR